jgi:CBS domain-containing protein
MSPRAAWRLESLGVDHVYDYVPGKADWLAFGLPYEGYARLAGEVLTRDVPTCSFRDRLEDVRDRLERSPFGMVVALNHEGVVMGQLRVDALDRDRATTVDQVMREGPTTVRPSEDLDALTERMRRANVDGVLVTRSDGTLLGLLERRRAEQALGGQG